MLEARDIVAQTAISLKPIDDLAVVVLFSIPLNLITPLPLTLAVEQRRFVGHAMN